jgi:proline iminopeptidase
MLREEAVEVDDGAVLHAVTEGQGRPVVLCHGGPGDIADTLGPLAGMLVDVAEVHRYDQRACGRSSGGPPFTMSRSVADLEALRGHWGYRRWMVGGHSFGAGLALAYALEHPERTEAVLYMSCVVRLCGDRDWHEDYRRSRLARIPEPQRQRYIELRRKREVERDVDPVLAAELRQLGLVSELGDAGVAERFVGELHAGLASVNDVVNRELGADFAQYFATASMRERLRNLDVPVLVVHGDADPRPLAAVEALASELPGAELVVLPEVGHFPYLEAPEALARVVRRFLASLP